MVVWEGAGSYHDQVAKWQFGKELGHTMSRQQKLRLGTNAGSVFICQAIVEKAASSVAGTYAMCDCDCVFV